MRSFEPCIAAIVPHPLANLLRLLLAVSPASRPSAEAARVTLASLASQALSWQSGGGAPGEDALGGDSYTLVAYDVDGVEWQPASGLVP